MRIRMTVSLVALGCFLGPAGSHADGECVKGFHETTPSERETMTAVLETARQALPVPPTGWINTLNDDRPLPPTSFCMDVVPWPYSYGRHYSRVEGQAERDQALAAAGAVLRAEMDRKQPRIDALMAKGAELSAELGAAATSGDNARVEALNVEIERVSKELQAVMDEGDPNATFEAATADVYSDIEMSIRVTVNALRQESPPADAETWSVPGASSAYRWVSGDDRRQGHAVVLFGQWQPSDAGYGMQAVTRPGAGPEQPHTIAIQFLADAKRIPAIVEATDFGAVAALLAR